MRGVVSLASSITSGAANEFISYGSDGTRLNEFVNCYTRNDMVLTDFMNPGRGNQLPRATDAQKRPLADFQSETLYKSIGWDFNQIWKIPEGGGFPVFKCPGCPVNVPTIKAKPTNLNVYKSNGLLILEAANPTSVWVYNIAGALVERINVEVSKSLSLPNGIYIIKSECNGNVEAVKVVN